MISNLGARGAEKSGVIGRETVCRPVSQVRTFALASDALWVMLHSIGHRRCGHRLRGAQNEAPRATTAERARSRWQQEDEQLLIGTAQDRRAQQTWLQQSMSDAVLCSAVGEEGDEVRSLIKDLKMHALLAVAWHRHGTVFESSLVRSN